MNLNKLRNELKVENLTMLAYIRGEFYQSTLRGIAPILDPMKEQRDFFKGGIVVDKVIGKATAMLLVLSGVRYIYAIVLSQHAKNVLDYYNIDYDYDEVVDYIVNRDQTGMCPMEKTVYDIDDLDEAFQALVQKQYELRKGIN